ncbi:hypothetical protein OE165_28245, partial [Escherichia coli]|uniref:hypothetical protein n=1 Tax=Escherichia coli TaxID=562 RepID=UPI0021F307DB
SKLFQVQKALQNQAEEADLEKSLKLEAAKTLAKTPKGATALLAGLFGVPKTTAEATPIAKPASESVGGKKLKTLQELRAE